MAQRLLCPVEKGCLLGLGPVTSYLETWDSELEVPGGVGVWDVNVPCGFRERKGLGTQGAVSMY